MIMRNVTRGDRFNAGLPLMFRYLYRHIRGDVAYIQRDECTHLGSVVLDLLVVTLLHFLDLNEVMKGTSNSIRALVMSSTSV